EDAAAERSMPFALRCAERARKRCRRVVHDGVNVGLVEKLEDTLHRLARRMDEILVADDERAVAAVLVAEPLPQHDLVAPLSRHAERRGWPPDHSPPCFGAVAAVPHEVDQLRVRKIGADSVEAADVIRRLVAPAAGALSLRKEREQSVDHAD